MEILKTRKKLKHLIVANLNVVVADFKRLHALAPEEEVDLGFRASDFLVGREQIHLGVSAHTEIRCSGPM